MSLKELLSELSMQPHSTVIEAVDSKLFPLAENLVFSHNPEFLASEEYKRCLDIFEKRLKGKFRGNNIEFMSKGYMEAMGMLMDTMSWL